MRTLVCLVLLVGTPNFCLASPLCDDVHDFFPATLDFVKEFAIERNDKDVGELKSKVFQNKVSEEWRIDRRNVIRRQKTLTIERCEVVEHTRTGDEVVVSADSQWTRRIPEFSAPYKNSGNATCTKLETSALAILGEDTQIMSIKCVQERKQAIYKYASGFGFVGYILERYSEDKVVPDEEMSVYLIGIDYQQNER